MVCRNFIRSESANDVFFFARFNLCSLSYLILLRKGFGIIVSLRILRICGIIETKFLFMRIIFCIFGYTTIDSFEVFSYTVNRKVVASESTYIGSNSICERAGAISFYPGIDFVLLIQKSSA